MSFGKIRGRLEKWPSGIILPENGVIEAKCHRELQGIYEYFENGRTEDAGKNIEIFMGVLQRKTGHKWDYSIISCPVMFAILYDTEQWDAAGAEKAVKDYIYQEQEEENKNDPFGYFIDGLETKIRLFMGDLTINEVEKMIAKNPDGSNKRKAAEMGLREFFRMGELFK